MEKILASLIDIILITSGFLIWQFIKGNFKWETTLFMVLVALALVAWDVIAFEDGATATMSQVLLGWQMVWCATIPCIFAIFCVLTGHLTTPHVPGNPYNWTRIWSWSAIYGIEAFFLSPIGATLFAQQPNMDMKGP